MKGSWLFNYGDDGAGMTRRERNHAFNENQADKKRAREHVEKLARKARDEKALKQRRQREEKANAERAQKMRKEQRARADAANKARANRGEKRGWWFS